LKEERMSKLFKETEINGMKLANRFVRSATWEGMATGEGAVTPRLIELYRRLAQGRIGLIITSHAYVRKDGQAGLFQIGGYDDGLIEGLRTMVETVHAEKGKIAAQLAHAGLFSNTKLSGEVPVAVSSLEKYEHRQARVMDEADIEAMVESFRRAADRARKAEFDGVQLHAGHGYLLSQFLSPYFNRRKDGYGGSAENRARAVVEVLQAVRKTVGKSFPVLIKMNSEDFLEGGLTVEDAVQTGLLLQDAGIDAIELSGGTILSGKLEPSRGGIKSEDKEAYFKDAARAFKEKLRVPIILVGGIRSFGVAEKLVEEGCADYISMSRPFIREPDLVRRWESGDRSKAKCISDNQCFEPGRAGEGVYCVTERKRRAGAREEG
jgi:2,4-dienoyl-CoA reductase-like NADH-dependent reductase (Old Yellow Enzyme family)